jgi:hypothetical protein
MNVNSLKQLTCNKLKTILPDDCIESLKESMITKLWFVHVYFPTKSLKKDFKKIFIGVFDNYELMNNVINKIPNKINYYTCPFNIIKPKDMKKIYICLHPFFYTFDWNDFKNIIDCNNQDKKYYEYDINESTY